MQSMISEDKPQANSRGQDSDYDFINAADCVDSGVAASEPHGSRKARNSVTSSSMQKNTKPPLSLTLPDSLFHNNDAVGSLNKSTISSSIKPVTPDDILKRLNQEGDCLHLNTVFFLFV